MNVVKKLLHRGIYNSNSNSTTLKLKESLDKAASLSSTWCRWSEESFGSIGKSKLKTADFLFINNIVKTLKTLSKNAPSHSFRC